MSRPLICSLLPNPLRYHGQVHLHLFYENTRGKANLVCLPLLLALQRLPLRVQRNRRTICPYRQPTHSDQP